MKSLKDILYYIVKSLVDNPDEVNITGLEKNGETVFEVRVAQSDMGKIIGRQGRVIKSIRTLARAASAYVGGSRIEVEVVD